MAATKGVKEVLSGRIAGLVGSLDATLGHHGVGVADSEFGDDGDFSTVVVSFDGGGRTSTAATDNQHIGINIRVLQIDFSIQNAGVSL